MLSTKKNHVLRYLFIIVGMMIAFLGCGVIQVSAHGFVTNPGGRAYLGSTWYPGGPLNTNIGSVMYEPQSIEAPQNTFIDGKIASAGIANFAPLDEQNAKRWYKTPVKAGNLSVTWQLTARHKTSTWDYYITKPGWNPNAPLKFSDFKKIASYNDNGAIPSEFVTHQVNISVNEKGYQVLLSVWNIADTGNAFYQVSDIDVQ